jgi:hypothetical protein
MRANGAVEMARSLGRSIRGKAVAVTMVLTSVLTTVSAMAFAPSAAAEGDFESSLVSVRAGFESRRWHDNNRDSVSTGIHFANCTSNPEVTLYEDRNLLPDRKVGDSQIAWCLNTNGQWLQWGDLAAGNYYFEISDTRSTNGYLSVEYVHVAW